MRERLSVLKKPITKYTVSILLFVIPLYPKFPLLSIAGSQVSVRLEDVVVFLSLVVWAAFYFEPRKFLKDKLYTAMVVFWFASLVSLLSGVFVTGTAPLSVGLLHWARRVEYMAPMLLGMSAVSDSKDLAFYTKCIFISIIVVFVVGVGQKHLNWPVITTQNYEYAKGIALRYVPGSHLVSTFAGHYDLASYLVFYLPFLYTLLLAPFGTLSKLSLSSRKGVSRGIVAVLIVMSLWLLVNTASRISLVSYLGSVVFGLLIIRRYKFIPLVIIVSILFVGFSSNLIDRYTRIFKVTVAEVMASDAETVPQRRAMTPTPTAVPEPFEDRSTSIRLNVEWPRAIRSLTKNPLLGTGYSSISLATDNDYLRSLGETGVLGTLALGAVFIRIVVLFIKVFPIKKIYTLKEAYVVGIFSALPGIFLNMVFIDILEASKFAITFWLAIGLGIASVSKATSNEED